MALAVNTDTIDLTTEIARFSVQLDGYALTDELLEALQTATIDTLAAMLSGVKEDVTRLIVRSLLDCNPRQRATVVGYGDIATLSGAALANGTMAHACDYDDSSWTMWGHPTAPVLAAILPIAEVGQQSGRDFLAALAVGIEVEKTIGLSIQPQHYDAGWHSTGTLGVFGAAAGAAKALKLTASQTAQAIGMACSMSSGLRANSGTMTKALHVGFAARNGVEAAQFVASGITANPRALDGTRGFLETFGLGASGRPGVSNSLGAPFEVMDPGLSPKLYPCCSDMHAAIDAALLLRHEHGLAAKDICRIRCGMTAGSRANSRFTSPRTSIQAKFSVEYCIATAIVRGAVGLDEFDDRAISDPITADLMTRIDAYVDTDLDKLEPASFSAPAVVEIETVSGDVYSRTVREMRGHPRNPLSPAEIEGKFVMCAGRVLDRTAVAQLLIMLRDIKSLGNISPMIALLRP
jgi:2-methylcitrate dehydratase PrpD